VLLLMLGHKGLLWSLSHLEVTILKLPGGGGAGGRPPPVGEGEGEGEREV
jgi:hypothetical protein